MSNRLCCSVVAQKYILIPVHLSGLQTFESVEPTTKEPQEPEAKPEVQEEQTSESKSDFSDVVSM